MYLPNTLHPCLAFRYEKRDICELFQAQLSVELVDLGIRCAADIVLSDAPRTITISQVEYLEWIMYEQCPMLFYTYLHAGFEET